MARFTYGGQALIEGVLMRGRSAVAVAMRHPDGSIVTATEGLDSPLHRSRYGRWPFVRGLVVLYDTLVVGFLWLTRSANVAASGEGVELGRGSVAIMIIVAIGLGVGIFLLLPLLLAQLTIRGPLAGLLDPLAGGNPVVEHLLEGVLRLLIFVGYLFLISRAADVRRVFQYHGAEHMTIHALENGDPLVPAALRRFGARNRANALVRAVFMPGIWLQMITTRQPDDGMVEVAIVSMSEALVADGETVPEGSVVPASRRYVFGGPLGAVADASAE